MNEQETCGDPNPTATWGLEFRGRCTQPKGHDGPHRVSWPGAVDAWVHEGEPGFACIEEDA